jgi:hypothetical protein
LGDVLSSSIEIVELGSTGAAVQVTTDLDRVCSVVYGTDESYGGQTTDPDMGGMAHRQHYAPVRGLAPDTVYHYRVQGIASDGSMYVSDDLTFRTPPEDAGSGNEGRDIASADAGARVIEVSSEFADSWSGENAIDGDPQTEWSSAGDGDDAFIEIELAESSDLTAVGFWTRTMGTSAQVSSFRVIADNQTELGPFDIPDSVQMYTFPITITAQRLRYEAVSSSGGNTGAVELAAFVQD